MPLFVSLLAKDIVLPSIQNSVSNSLAMRLREAKMFSPSNCNVFASVVSTVPNVQPESFLLAFNKTRSAKACKLPVKSNTFSFKIAFLSIPIKSESCNL